jgi:cyclophilin family peptidyl-prolyl cis-trans isomerase
VQLLLVLALLASPQESEAARKARTHLDQIKSAAEKFQKIRERLDRNSEDFRKGASDEEELKKLAAQRQEIVREYQDLSAAAGKMFDELLNTATAGLRADPGDAALLEIRGEGYRLFGRRREALADLERVARARPDDRDLALRVARLLHELNRFAASAAAHEKALEKGGGNAEARTLLAMAYFNLHRFEDAVRVFGELEKDPPQAKVAGEQRRLAAAYADLWKAEQEIRSREAKADDLPRVRITTARGEIELELFENEAPNTVANFVELVSRRFYDNLLFHRVIPGFMVQGGCPRGDGTGDAGYRFKDEVGAGGRRHFRGSISMANSGPDTNGSQFFITHLPTEHLNGKHTVFGRVLKGQEVVDEIQQGDRILKAEVIRKRDHEYKVARIAEEK